MIGSCPIHNRQQGERGLKILPANSHLAQTTKNLKATAGLTTDVLSRSSETTRTLPLAVESIGIELALLHRSLT
ncbi:hypothetical protein FHX77_000943 [Bifidobacterium commune]|nr:hypothetical protein [Bifidobacterium commune]